MNGYREITARGVALGAVQRVLMTAAFPSAGLKLGFGVGGSSVAAIMGFVVLRGLLGNGTIVENNINQTVASGINTASSGVIFTLPALLLLGLEFDWRMMTLAAVAGSFMGIVVIIALEGGRRMVHQVAAAARVFSIISFKEMLSCSSCAVKSA